MKFVFFTLFLFFCTVVITGLFYKVADASFGFCWIIFCVTFLFLDKFLECFK